MAEQCFAYVRRKWNAAYPNNKLTHDAITGPQLWEMADDLGYSTSDSDSPVAKSVACWDDGGYGHVTWVIKDNEDGTMDISESNWPIGQGSTKRTITVGDRGANGNYELLGFVYP